MTAWNFDAKRMTFRASQWRSVCTTAGNSRSATNECRPVVKLMKRWHGCTALAYNALSVIPRAEKFFLPSDYGCLPVTTRLRGNFFRIRHSNYGSHLCLFLCPISLACSHPSPMKVVRAYWVATLMGACRGGGHKPSAQRPPPDRNLPKEAIQDRIPSKPNII